MQTRSNSARCCWRDLMVRRYRQPDAEAASRFVVMSYLSHGPIYNQLIELDRFIPVLLYEEPSTGRIPIIRLAGYEGALTATHVHFGGAEQCRFFKNLALTPSSAGNRARLASSNSLLTRLALRMECRLQAERRHWYRPRQVGLQFPQLWAAYRQADAVRVGLDTCTAKAHHNLYLFPVGQVKSVLAEAVTCYVDLSAWPALQCFALHSSPGDLAGMTEAVLYDFYGSRYRSSPKQRHRTKFQTHRRAYRSTRYASL